MCNFCKRTGHLEVACRQKEEARGKQEGKGPGGEGFFYGGGYCAMAELQECDSHHNPLQQIPNISVNYSNRFEAMAAEGIDRSTDFMVDSGASHHICHRREFFTDLSTLPGPFKVQQIQGTVEVTQLGSVMVEVDSVHGKVPFMLKNVLFIPTMNFNIISLQKLVAANFIPVYNEIPEKVVIKKILQQGGVEQVALLSKSTTGRLTLDCRILRSTVSQPSTSQGEVFLNTPSMELLHRPLGHSGEAVLRRLLKDDMATGINPVAGSISPDIVAPALNEDVVSEWWRGPEAVVTEDDEPVLFSGVLAAPPAETPPESVVVDISPGDTISADADSAPPPVAAPTPEVMLAPPLTPAPTRVPPAAQLPAGAAKGAQVAAKGVVRGAGKVPGAVIGAAAGAAAAPAPAIPAAATPAAPAPAPAPVSKVPPAAAAVPVVSPPAAQAPAVEAGGAEGAAKGVARAAGGAEGAAGGAVKGAKKGPGAAGGVTGAAGGATEAPATQTAAKSATPAPAPASEGTPAAQPPAGAAAGGAVSASAGGAVSALAEGAAGALAGGVAGETGGAIGATSGAAGATGTAPAPSTAPTTAKPAAPAPASEVPPAAAAIPKVGSPATKSPPGAAPREAAEATAGGAVAAPGGAVGITAGGAAGAAGTAAGGPTVRFESIVAASGELHQGQLGVLTAFSIQMPGKQHCLGEVLGSFPKPKTRAASTPLRPTWKMRHRDAPRDPGGEATMEGSSYKNATGHTSVCTGID